MSRSKLDILLDHLKGYDRSLFAYSAGVDSTFLIKAASMAGIDFIAVTSSSETVPEPDLQRAKEITTELGIEHMVIFTGEMNSRKFTENPTDRCYYCKDILFSALKKISNDKGYEHILEGSNADDVRDHRPGLRACSDRGIISPLMECGLTKDEIRSYSREYGLRTWDIPSSPCLSSRFPYGERITLRGLSMVSAAEDVIRGLGFKVVRVRTTGTSATVEVGADEMDRLGDSSLRSQIEQSLINIGYDKVSFDPEGYVSGKLNRTIPS